MDYHFYLSRDKAPQPQGNVRNVYKYFFPLFIAAALLPVLVALVQKPIQTRFGASARTDELAVWLDPANVEAARNTPVKFTVKANFDTDSTTLLPGVSFPVHVEGAAAITDASIVYKKPFAGEVDLGGVTVIAQRTGKVTVFIDPKTVVSQGRDPFNVTVSSATLVVK